MEAMGTMAAWIGSSCFCRWLVCSPRFWVAIIKMGITAIDGSVDRLVENMGTIRPTFLAAVPRVFEKVYNKVVAGANEAGGLKLRIFQWAMKQGYAVSAIRQGVEAWGLLALKYAVADRLVFSSFGRRLAATYGFHLRWHSAVQGIAEFFHARVHILEECGLTESRCELCGRPSVQVWDCRSAAVGVEC